MIDDGVPANEPVAYGTFDSIDAATQAIIDEEGVRVEAEMSVVLGETPFFMDGERDPGVRTQETNLGDFCADAVRWTAEQELDMTVDAALLNGGGLRSSIEAGDISLMTIKTVFAFENNVCVVKVTGAGLLEALEAACQAVGAEKGIGAFPQVSGITFTIDASVPYEEGPVYPDSVYPSPAAPGARVTIADVGGRGFDEGETYTVATNDFVSSGGDAFYAFREAAEAEEPLIYGFDYEAMASYLVEGCDHVVPDTYAEAQDRITIVGR